MEIRFPYNDWRARPHQKALWNYLEQGGKRALAVWHRRAGKDEVCLHHTAVSMHLRPGNYWTCLPEYNQARKAIWSAINAHTGKRRIDEVFPAALRETYSDNEMFIRMKNGSTWQLIGSDRYDSTVGAGVAGITYSEWALSNPSAWAFHRPMLQENDGWAIFISTPRGHNHCKAMFDYAGTQNDWFCELLTARDTGALGEDDLEEALEEYRSLYGLDVGTAQFQQEYLCSWNAAILGAFYSLEIADVRREERVREIDAIPNAAVHRAWDLGIRDDTSVWWFQYTPSGQCYILDCISQSGVGVEYFATEIESRRKKYGWKDGDDWVPHDAKVKEWGSGRTRVETMREFGLRPNLIPLSTIADGINAVRRLLPVCVFHPRCKEGLEALEQYRREWNDEAKTFRASAVHDWCFTGDTKVLTRYGAQRFDELPRTGEVLTPCGWKQYHSPRITRRDAPLVEVEFADGLTVRCTPDHMFMTDSGWRSAESLTSTTRIRSCLTPSRSISMAASTAFGRVKTIIHAAARSFTAMRGRRLSALFQRTATSTIATATCTTMLCQTSNAFQVASTDQRFGRNYEIEARSNLHQRLTQQQQIGIAQRPASCGTSAMPSGKRRGPSGSASQPLARRAASRLMRSFAKVAVLKSIAATIAGSPDRVVASVRPLETRADVWCLSVPDGEWFALANGAVTHNCSHYADAFRYLALSRRPHTTKVYRPPQISRGIVIPPPPTAQTHRGLVF